jgi:PEGA domain
MAKNESTAVNELIQRVATMTPLRPDPADDLLFRAPPPPPSKQAASKQAPSKQAPGGEVAPLPRTRSAHGTPAGAMTMKGLGPVVKQALAANALPPPPPSSIDDGWAEDATVVDKPPVPAPARSRRAANAAAPASASASQAMPKAPPPPPPARVSQAQPAQLMSAQSTQSMSAQSTQSMSAQSMPQSMPLPLSLPLPPPRHQTEAPASMPVAAPFESSVMPSFGRAKPGSLTTGSHAVSPVAVEPARERSEQSAPAPQQEAWAATMFVRRPRSKARKLIAPLIAVSILGAAAGGYVAFFSQSSPPRGSDASSAPATPAMAASPALAAPASPAMAAPASPAPASPAPASPAPAAEPAHGSVVAAGPPAPASPAAEPALAPASAPSATPTPSSFVDVMIVSSPPGATVTLVDHGLTLLIGSTPITTALDPSRKYELIFSHPSRATWVESIDPAQTRRVDVKLGPATKAEAKAEAKLAAARASAPAARASTPAARETAASRAEAPRAEKAVATPAGEGILMISSKPPCEIVIDGKPTGLTTPQREIPLPAGAHKITLVNKAEDINKTISVQITADQPTKVIQNLMNQ